MNQDRPKSGNSTRSEPPAKAEGRPIRWPTIIVVLLAFGAVWVAAKILRKPEPAIEITSVPTRSDARPDRGFARPVHVPANSGDTASHVEVSNSAQSPAAPGGSSSGTIPIPAPVTPPVQPEQPRTEATPLTQQMVASLTQLDLRRGAVTPEQAAQWKQGLQQLVAQGASAVPAIRDFLEKNLDLRFDGLAGGNVAGYSSLRAGLFDALLQIGGADAVAVSRDVLRTTADPLEIAMLARNLEQQAPGQYRFEALNAARMTLEQAAQSSVNGRDVAPLFQLFQTYGDASYVAALQHTLPKWSYYETLALAGLPEGQGLPLLINQVQDPKSAGSTGNNFALQVLAQMAGQYPDAGTALVEQARLNRIPDQIWRQIGQVLAGNQFQFGSQVIDNTLPPASGSGVSTYHIEYGNQNFYTTPLGANASAEQIAQRRAVIDQLLGVTSNPTAVAALQAAKNSLPGGQPKP